MSMLGSIQAALNVDYPGWHVSHFVCLIGGERVTNEGDVESVTALYVADGQADYITTGLLCAAEWLRYDDEGED